MPDSKFEEAKRCPSCKQPGEPGQVQPQRDGSKVHTFTCRNALCQFSDVGWIVQTMPDGSVAPKRDEREMKLNKTFPKYTNDQEAAFRRILEDAKGY